MESFFKEIITILISVTTITGLIIWFLKEVIKKFIQADTEKQKHRFELEHQKYTKLQNEQFETIKTIYSNLIRTDELLKESFSVIKDGREFDKDIMERTIKPLVSIIFESDRHFKKNNIFLNDQICNKIEKCIDALFFCLTKSSYAILIKSKDVFNSKGEHLGIQEQKLEELSENNRKEFEETIRKVEEVRNNELKESIEILKLEFRKLFGVK